MNELLFLREQGVHNNNRNNITNDDNALDIYAAIYYIPFTWKIVSKRSSYLFLSIFVLPIANQYLIVSIIVVFTRTKKLVT